MEQTETEGWKSAVVGKGPFKAELGEFPNNGWWVVVSDDGKRIDDSGDGRFFEAAAKFIADSLNQQTRIKELEMKNVRLRLALKSIIRATDEYPAHTFVRMVAHEALGATDEGTNDDG